MDIECEVYHFTPAGMRPGISLAGTSYIRVRDAERLLAKAYVRGKRQALEEFEKVIKETKL
jgi:hypothetical protein